MKELITPYDNPPTDDMFEPIDNPDSITCPICDCELTFGDEVFKNEGGYIIACHNCIVRDTVNASDLLDGAYEK